MILIVAIILLIRFLDNSLTIEHLLAFGIYCYLARAVTDYILGRSIMVPYGELENVEKNQYIRLFSIIVSAICMIGIIIFIMK